MSVRNDDRRSGSEFIDISVPVDPEATPMWPGSPPLSLDRRLSLDRGDPVNDTTIRCSVHTGTHVDAPSHFLDDGATVDSLPPDAMVGPCTVADLRGTERVDRPELEARLGERSPDRLLLRTDNSERWGPEFRADFVGLTPSAARLLGGLGVRLLGIDYLSVQPFEGSDAVHRSLLEADVVLLEGLDLSGIAPGRYELLCLPVRLAGVEAAPARALLRPPEEGESESSEER